MVRMGRRGEEQEEEEASECSSGCQSGWTMYLDQSHDNLTSPLTYKKGSGVSQSQLKQEEEEEEEDLSMVSDASSGPPHFHEDAALMAESGGKRRRVVAEQQPHPRGAAFLDDTASSPLFTFPRASCKARSMKAPAEEHALEFSSCFSATHFKRNPALEKHLSYMQSSSHVKPTAARPACRKEEEDKMW